MQFSFFKKLLPVAAAILAVIVLWRWVLPVAVPFLLGALVALAAEPLVALLHKKLPRGASAAIGVSAALLGLIGLLVVLTAVLLRQLGTMTQHVPGLIRSANDSLDSLHHSLLLLSEKAPKSLQPMLERSVDDLFQSGGSLVSGFLQRLPAALTTVLSALTGSALAVGTGCLAAYMISARLPQLKAALTDPERFPGRLLPRLKRLRSALWGWLKAQFLLSGVCFLILSLAFLLLGISKAPLWAFLTALVDAVPLLGTGTVLIPWALVCLIQHNSLRAIGLLVSYGVTFLARSALEPRLVGQQLGLDPLLTLVSLYTGYHFWGIAGMLLSPMLCVLVKEVLAPAQT